MISAPTLLKDLQKWVKSFEDDLRERCKEAPELDAHLRSQYDAARTAKRTGHPYGTWRDESLTQSAVAWVLACTFVRFLEDNDLLETPFLSGPGELRELAGETRAYYFREHRAHSDDDYLRHVFRQVATLPGMADLFDARHNELWNAGISGDAAKSFIEFWRKIDPNTGRLTHDFSVTTGAPSHPPSPILDPQLSFSLSAGDSSHPPSTINDLLSLKDPTRFLGDLYQSLSESARKRFALLQTPDFIEEFILDRTLEPAVETFGFEVVRMIDPTCGSGHFLLGAFARQLARWQKAHPELSEREIAMKALAAIHGVDINPFAVAIARFRLLLAAWRFCGVKKLRNAPDFHVHLAVGDALLHGRRFRESEGESRRQSLFETADEAFADELKHFNEVEDRETLHHILGQQYHAVVGNPPYITVKDLALSDLYRDRYPSCHRQYSLSVPFMERIFDLAIAGDFEERQPAGFTGQITGNTFMKREFGKPLIEQYLPRWDVTHVIDTSGVYIPGHGTPTVILFGKNQKPVTDTIRTVFGIRGEPTTPGDPAHGYVWQAIVRQVDQPGTQCEWVSSSDSPRADFRKHPWSIGGGGLRELKDQIESTSSGTLDDEIVTICAVSYTRLDEAYLVSREVLSRHEVPQENQIEFVAGDNVRDWAIINPIVAGFPYDAELKPLAPANGRGIHRFLWPFREDLWRRREINGDHRELNRTWWEWNRFLKHRFIEAKSIAFAEIATHNNFVFDSSWRVFSQTAPVIKPKPDASSEDCRNLTGILNSSIGCFWLKQVCFPKGGSGIGRGIQSELWEGRFAFDGTKIRRFPLVESHKRPTQLPLMIIKYGDAIQYNSPTNPIRNSLLGNELLCKEHRRKLIAWQEELDWQVYEAYGLIGSDDHLSVPEGRGADLVDNFGLALGERAFEIVLARRMAAAEVQTTWFARHGSTPVTELPAHWPAAYRELVERRIRRIETDPNIRLIEQPEYKRRWNTEPWDKQQQNALERWLLDRLETYFHDSDRMLAARGQKSEVRDQEEEDVKIEIPEDVRAARGGHEASGDFQFTTVQRLASAAMRDPKFMEAAAVYTGEAGFQVAKLVEKLVLSAAVPFLPGQRYKDSGLRKRQQWEDTWNLQRREDAIDAEEKTDEPGLSDLEKHQRLEKAANRKRTEIGDIPVPPKYTSADFKKSTYWSHRGKLDVPKERFILYPGAEGGWDDSPVLAWAGWDHAQQARALCGYYQQALENWAWPETKLAPLLAGLADLLPWLHQWHHAIDPEFHEPLATIYQAYYHQQRHALRLTDEQIEAVRMNE
jgi:hypothetical protein